MLVCASGFDSACSALPKQKDTPESVPYGNLLRPARLPRRKRRSNFTHPYSRIANLQGMAGHRSDLLMWMCASGFDSARSASPKQKDTPESVPYGNLLRPARLPRRKRRGNFTHPYSRIANLQKVTGHRSDLLMWVCASGFDSARSASPKQKDTPESVPYGNLLRPARLPRRKRRSNFTNPYSRIADLQGMAGHRSDLLM